MDRGQDCLFGVLALLVGNGAGGLAGGLAGSLALAAAAPGSGLLKVCLVKSFDVFHFVFLHLSMSFSKARSPGGKTTAQKAGPLCRERLAAPCPSFRQSAGNGPRPPACAFC